MRAQVVLLAGDRILLCRHQFQERAFWVLPGGSVENGETPGVAAIREVREETGLEVGLERTLFVEEPCEGEVPIRSPRHTFLGRIMGGALETRQETPPGRSAFVGAAWMPWQSDDYDSSLLETLQRVRDALF